MKLKLLINKNQDLILVQGTIYLTKAITLCQQMDQKEKTIVEKEYKKLFSVSLKDQILEIIDLNDDMKHCRK